MKCFTDMNLFDYVCNIFSFFVCFGVQSQWTHLPNTSPKVQRKLGRRSRQVVKPRGLGSSLRVFFYFPIWWLSHKVFSPLSVCSSDKYCAPGLHASFYDTSHGEEWHGLYLGSSPMQSDRALASDF